MLNISSVSKTQACLLVSFNLTPWHLLKSHPVSLANSSRVNYPLSCFMAGIFLWDHSGLSSPERSGFAAVVRMNSSFPIHGMIESIRLHFFFFSGDADTEQILQMVSNHCLQLLLHILNTIWATMSWIPESNLLRRNWFLDRICFSVTGKSSLSSATPRSCGWFHFIWSETMS